MEFATTEQAQDVDTLLLDASQWNHSKLGLYSKHFSVTPKTPDEARTPLIYDQSCAKCSDDGQICQYEAIGLIPKAARRDFGYRDYDEREVHMLRFIGRARDLGFPVFEIGQLVALWQDADRTSGEVKALALSRAREMKRKERELRTMRKSLEELRSSLRWRRSARLPYPRRSCD